MLIIVSTNVSKPSRHHYVPGRYEKVAVFTSYDGLIHYWNDLKRRQFDSIIRILQSAIRRMIYILEIHLNIINLRRSQIPLFFTVPVQRFFVFGLNFCTAEKIC